MSPDMLNATFEAFSGLMILNHCRVLVKAKDSSGISLLSTAFFAAWGLWNVVYYYGLGQFFSWGCGMGITAANMLWVGLIVRYRRAA